MKPRLPAAIYAIGATSLLNDASSEMIFPLLPVFLSSVLGASAATLGVIEGTADAAASLLKLVSGALSDRLGRRKPLVVGGYALASLVRPLVAFAQTAGAVLAIRAIDRVGKGLRASPRDALIADAAPRELHGRAFGVHEAMDHAGAVVGPLAAYLLLAIGVGLRSVFLLSALPAAIACLVVVLFVREARPRPREPAVAAAAATVSIVNRPFLGYLLATIVFALGNSSDAFLLLRVHDAGLPAQAAPLLWALHHVVKSTTSAKAGELADRLGRRRALAAGWIAYAAIYAGFAFARSGWAIAGLFVIYGLHFALVGGAQKALVADLVPVEARARGFGMYHLCVGLAALPASLLFGLLYQRLGSGTAFLTGAGLALGAVAVLPLSRTG
ncbi:MAG: MFS transporter [Polyangia bacterium]|jgi:MFS family permease